MILLFHVSCSLSVVLLLEIDELESVFSKTLTYTKCLTIPSSRLFDFELILRAVNWEPEATLYILLNEKQIAERNSKLDFIHWDWKMGESESESVPECEEISYSYTISRGKKKIKFHLSLCRRFAHIRLWLAFRFRLKFIISHTWWAKKKKLHDESRFWKWKKYSSSRASIALMSVSMNALYDMWATMGYQRDGN